MPNHSPTNYFDIIVSMKTIKAHATSILFATKLFEINSRTILLLPADASVKLPSRGMVMVKGTINNVPFKAVLEPDGRYGKDQGPSHWFSPSKELLTEAHAKAGDTVKVELEPTKEWINPEVPDDMKQALESSKKIQDLWNDITPMARWDWIRWVRAVKTDETRKKHIEIMVDKLNKGMRRPCCFNRNLCSDPTVSQNWVLLDPTKMTS